jgi:WD40 repeat protein
MGGRGEGRAWWLIPLLTCCRGHKGTIWSVVASGGHLYSGSSDGSIKMWDILDLRKGCLRTVSAHKDCVSPPQCVCGHADPLPTLLQALCMAVGHGILYSAGTDLCIRSWHLDSLEEIGSVQVIESISTPIWR